MRLSNEAIIGIVTLVIMSICLPTLQLLIKYFYRRRSSRPRSEQTRTLILSTPIGIELAQSRRRVAHSGDAIAALEEGLMHVNVS